MHDVNKRYCLGIPCRTCRRPRVSSERTVAPGIKAVPILPSCPAFSMCYWRRVQNTFKVCGHVVTLPDEEIKCDLRNCKFSPKHSANCVPPQCTKTCWQYHQYPQQYAPQLDKKCPKCSG